jgi:cytoskeletal protein RodZ
LNILNFKIKAMKTNYILSVLLVFLLFICSCKKELEPQESSAVTIPSDSASTSTNSVSSALTNNSTPNASSTQQNSSLNAVVMNPPHGQAGHRCDIAVGAPLNSTPNKSTTTPASSVSNVAMPTIVKSNAPAVVTKPGMNPPHGQTGHRCDIAVGAPLNSAPNKVVPPTPNPDSGSPVPALLKLDSTATSPKQ